MSERYVIIIYHPHIDIHNLYYSVIDYSMVVDRNYFFISHALVYCKNMAVTPTVDLFAEVLTQAGTSWFEIGVFLGASTTEMEVIRQNHATNGVVTCLIKLHECLVKKGKPLTWEAIATALKRLGDHRLADSIHSNYILPAIRRASSNEDSRGITNVRDPVYGSTGGSVDIVPVECAACRTKEEQIKQLHIDADALQQKYDNLTAEYDAYKMKKGTMFNHISV